MKALTALHKWQEAQLQLETTLDTFLDACTTLRLACSETTPEVESVVEQLCDRLDRLGDIDRKMATSRAITFGIRNGSAAVVPVTMLPPELLIKVFAYCIDHGCHGRELYRELYPHPLNTITGVCSRWRRIALGTSSLWSFIIVDSDLTHQRPSRIPTITRLWLERSVNAPLNLHVHSTSLQYDIEQLVPVLQPHLPRVSRLTFHSVSYELIHALFPQGRIPCVALSALCLNDIRVESDLLDEHDRSIWPVIHGLQELELVDIVPIVRPDPEELALILCRCPKLQILRIGLGDDIIYPMSVGQSDIYLPALRKLEFGSLGNNAVRALLSILRLSRPGLNVTLELSNRHDDEIALPIKSFLQHSDIAILKLRPSPRSLSPGFEHYLDDLPRCHTLTLEFLWYVVRFDSGFTLENLPELRVLNILGGEIVDSSWAEIIEISETRSLARIAFSKSVKFLGMRQGEVEICGWSSRLRQQVGEVVFYTDDF